MRGLSGPVFATGAGQTGHAHRAFVAFAIPCSAPAFAGSPRRDAIAARIPDAGRTRSPLQWRPE